MTAGRNIFADWKACTTEERDAVRDVLLAEAGRESRSDGDAVAMGLAWLVLERAAAEPEAKDETYRCPDPCSCACHEGRSR